MKTEDDPQARLGSEPKIFITIVYEFLSVSFFIIKYIFRMLLLDI